MSISRAVLLGILFATVALCAQPARARQAAAEHTVSAPAVTHTRRAAYPAHRSYEITLTFKRVVHGRLRTDKSYTLLTTAGQPLPAIRDDFLYRTSASCAEPACTIAMGTDVDILKLEPRGRSVLIELRISRKTIATKGPESLPDLPIAGSHQYLITPTVPIGKLVTVYSALAILEGSDIEVQLLIQPYDPNHSDPSP